MLLRIFAFPFHLRSKTSPKQAGHLKKAGLWGVPQQKTFPVTWAAGFSFGTSTEPMRNSYIRWIWGNLRVTHASWYFRFLFEYGSKFPHITQSQSTVRCHKVQSVKSSRPTTKQCLEKKEFYTSRRCVTHNLFQGDDDWQQLLIFDQDACFCLETSSRSTLKEGLEISGRILLKMTLKNMIPSKFLPSTR